MKPVRMFVTGWAALALVLLVAAGMFLTASPGHAGPHEAAGSFGPRDLFNMTELKNLTLRDGDLHWTEISTRVLPSGVTETIGSWSGGVWETFDVTGQARTITLSERAAIYWPPGYPSTLNSQAGFGHVYAAHVAMGLTGHVTVGEQLALTFGLPVLHHGEEAVDWESLGFGGRGDLTNMSGPNLVQVNPCALVDLARGNFGWVLARTNVRAITLLQCLAEERGGTVTRVALRGGSKEGFATWMASAVDDRVEVVSSGGYQREDLRTAISVYATDWGCEPPPAAGVESITETLIFLDWMTSTPAGRAAEQAFSVGLFQHDLYPRFALINGDVTRHDMHDGHHFALGMETYFLDHFAAVPWRYVRLHAESQEDTKEEILRTLLLEQLVNDSPGYLDQVYPRITSDRVETSETDGRRFRAFVTVTPEPEQVRLWWSHSDDRVWNDEENAPWVAVPLTWSEDGWVSGWVDLQQMGVGIDEEIAYYVEAENTYHVASYSVPRRAVSPVRFLWRLPPLACPIIPPNWCGIYLPLIWRS
ncbi:MAG: hypothetical protein KKA73_14960 [Chloroflexi bacterium]|nr:hypothetical protein [Chloroflexota bacterium]MBU1748987.1 hypothetical protein [Chloroflexota bacterium]